MNQRSKLLNLADSLVNGDRNRQYGDPRSDFQKTATFWEIYLNGIRERQTAEFSAIYEELGMVGGDAEAMSLPIMVDPHDVAVLMILLKITRLSWSPDKEDSWADIAGYAACGYDCIVEAGPDDDPETEALDNDQEFQDDIALDEEEADEAIKAYFAQMYNALFGTAQR